MRRLDPDERLIQRYLDERGYEDPYTRRPCASILRRFHRFRRSRPGTSVISRPVLEEWLRAVAASAPPSMVIRRAQIVDRFLDWRVANGQIPANPFAELRRACRPRGLRSIVPALLSDRPDEALAAIRALPRYGSRIGPAMAAHVARKRSLGHKYEEGRFLRLDRFLQQHSAAEPLPVVLRTYVEAASSPAMRYEHRKLADTVIRALQREDPAVPGLSRPDRLLKQAMRRQQRRPHIFSRDEVGRLLHAARRFPSAKAPLRPETLYTMLVVAYGAGLRVSELVGLTLQDFDPDESVLHIRNTKFFKSRRLPLHPSVARVVRQYLVLRERGSHSQSPDAPLFVHTRGGYAVITAAALLAKVIRAAGLKPEPGRRGPRVHDLRHTFVVHRMLAWYRDGINPESRLPYLATYLGHRDIHSTLVYLTITRELLAEAGERFRAYGARALAGAEELTS